MAKRGHGGYESSVNAFRHILVGTDFSDSSHAAVEKGLDSARASGAKLTLLHVCSPGVQALGAAGMGEGMAIGHGVHEALATLKDKITGVAGSHVDLVMSPSPAAAIVDYAAANGVDLVIVGSHGLEGAGRFLVGSVAERVVRHAPCSVLVARTKRG